MYNLFMRNNVYFNSGSINNALIWIVSILVFPISKFFVFLKIKPNSLTFFSVIFTVLAFYFLIINQYFLFLFFWLLNIIFDFCDGQVARISKNVNETLLRFDHLSDVFKISTIFLGTAIHLKDESLWIIIFMTNFFYLFFVILNHSISKTMDLKKNKKFNYSFFNYFKVNNIFVAIIKTLIPIIFKFNGHSLFLFFFLPLGKIFCLSILIYVNMIFLHGIVKNIKTLSDIKRL